MHCLRIISLAKMLIKQIQSYMIRILLKTIPLIKKTESKPAGPLATDFFPIISPLSVVGHFGGVSVTDYY